MRQARRWYIYPRTNAEVVCGPEEGRGDAHAVDDADVVAADELVVQVARAHDVGAARQRLRRTPYPDHMLPHSTRRAAGAPRRAQPPGRGMHRQEGLPAAPRLGAAARAGRGGRARAALGAAGRRRALLGAARRRRALLRVGGQVRAEARARRRLVRRGVRIHLAPGMQRAVSALQGTACACNWQARLRGR